MKKIYIVDGQQNGISKLEGRTIEIIQSEQKLLGEKKRVGGKKRGKEKEQSLRDL